jgi:predicted DNA-binding antitoxin AbrB/MazE fold protein
MYQIVKATYQDGLLKPNENLSLEDKQQVLVIILPLQSDVSKSHSSSERVTMLKEQAAIWLSQQSDKAIQPLSSEPKEVSLESILTDIRARASQHTSEEIAADISQALVEAQLIPADERTRLEAELDTIPFK